MRRDNLEFERIAHRGASREAPENTIPAIRLAVEKYRVDRVEVDIRLTRDRIPVVFHDESLERVTNGSGLFSHHSFAELKKLDAGFGFDPEGEGKFHFREKGITIPSLEEILTQFPETNFCLEIKENEKDSLGPIVDGIRKVERKGSLIVGSFKGKVARAFRRLSLAPHESFLAREEVVRAYLLFRLGFKKFRSPARYASLPRKEGWIRLDEVPWIEFLHRSGIKIFYWTVNETKEMEELIRRGADGIITDYPNQLNQILNSKS